jgi:hypothetical protein
MFQSFKRNRSLLRWTFTGVLATACLIASPQGVRSASAETFVNVRIAPPVERVEVVPARPSPHHLWTHGYWAWNGRRHIWVPGRYVAERPGYAWHESRWEGAGHGHWRFRRGGWHRR